MTTIRCEECGIGHCHAVKTPYLLNVGQHMLIMPDSPAYLCDVCGYRFFDDDFLDGVHALLLRATADTLQRQRRQQSLPPEPPQAPHLRRSH